MLLRNTAIVVLLALLTAGTAHARQDGKPMVASQAYLSTSALQAGSTFRLAVMVKIGDGFHVNAADRRASWPSKLVLESSPDIIFSVPQYPQLVMRTFAFSAGEKLPVYDGKVVIFVEGKVAPGARLGERKIEGVFAYQGCSESECFPPAEAAFSLTTKVVGPGEAVHQVHTDVFGTGAANDGAATPSDPPFKNGVLLTLLAVFGLGFLVSFTPCVYPMIPVTIGYFGTQDGKGARGTALMAAVYVAGLALTYSALGVVAALSGGVLGSALQSPYVTLAIAAVLVALALSMFGLYEFRAPSFVAAKSQDKRGILGALLMGLLFGIVVAPCAGPVTVGLMVLIAKSGNVPLGFLTLFLFALGMGTTLFFVAAFSGALTRLPQAGMWMVAVKKVSGLLLLGAAIYYLVPLIRTHVSAHAADRALPMFIMVSGLYIGWLEQSLRKMPKMKSVRKLIGLGAVVLGLVLISPPTQQVQPMTFRPYSEAALSRAVETGAPVMIDFSAEWCTYCLKLDRETFPDPKVLAEGERFVRLRADLTDGGSLQARSIQHKYRIKGLPTIVFIDSTGRESRRSRIVGFVTPKELLKMMRNIE